jgi:hypothetical protein
MGSCALPVKQMPVFSGQGHGQAQGRPLLGLAFYKKTKSFAKDLKDGLEA